MSRVRDIANILSGGSSAIATDAEITSASAYIPANVAGKNYVINGGFDVWQRGTSLSGAANGTYTADRWSNGRTGQAMTISRQLTGDSTNLAHIQYCARIQRDSGNTGTLPGYIVQAIETSNSIQLAGKTVTLSFYARAGSNFSTSGTAIVASLYTGTGSDQNPWNGYTGTANPNNLAPTLTTTWQRFSFTATLSSTASEILVQYGFTPTGTAGVNDYFEITGVQLEVGSVATPFSRSGGDVQGELAKCQRYYYRDTLEKHLTHVRDTNLWFITKTFPVRMRSVVSFSHNLTTKVTPGTFPGTAGQIAIYSNGWVAQNATALSCSSDGGSNDHGSFYIVGFNGTLGQVGSIQSNGASYFEWNGEI